jgi:hypothetical protein
MLLGNARYITGQFTEAEINESEQLKDARILSDNDQRILSEYAKENYILGLTPNKINTLVHLSANRGFCLAEKYIEIATVQDMRTYEEKLNSNESLRVLLDAEDIDAFDKFAESKGANVCQFVHRLVLIKPTAKNKMMFRIAFAKAIKSARSFSDLAKANSPDVRWLQGLEGLRINLHWSTEQRWFGRKNMLKYRKIILSKILELYQKATFEDCFKIACEYSRYKQDRYASGYSDNGDFRNPTTRMLIHFGSRQDLIDKMFRSCLSKATFEECLKAYNQVHNGRVSVFAIAQMEKLAKTAEHHWTIAQIAFRRKNTKLWKRHLKKAAAKV